MLNKLLVIYGPTATGKTDLAIKLAKKFSGELISADSRQVYQGLDIGSGKVSFESKVEKHKGYWVVDGIKIHGFDLVKPGIQFTVADFLKYTNNSIVQTIKLKKLPIIVGGTGFYIKALIDGIGSIGIPQDPALRRQLEGLSVDQLYQKLLEIDQKRAKDMNESDRTNPRRLIRAIEIAIYKKYHASSIKHQGNTKYSIQNTKYLLIGLTAPNSYLYSHCDKWLQTRLKHGMVEEVKNLLDKRVDSIWLDNLGLEYRWLTKYLLEKIDYNYAIERLKGDIHSFIRRQKTWFKKFPQIQLFDISKPDWRQKLEKKLKL